jgi:dCTP deaminase
MPVMPDSWIKEQAINNRMIFPFVTDKISRGVISYGLSSYGYDARVGSKFSIFSNVISGKNLGVIDPKNFSSECCVEIDIKDDACIIPPNGFALAHTVEYFRVPRDVIVICVGKSTYARCGIIINVTPLEPEWEGIVTLEISNTTPLPAKIYINEGICQCLFLKADSVCTKSYADIKGKYMHQVGISLPCVGK